MNGSEINKESKPADCFTPQDLAQALGVSTSTVKRWADQGRFTVRRTEGGHRRIPRPAALEFLREHGALAPGEAAPENPATEEVAEDSEGAVYLRLLSEGREVETVKRVLASQDAGQDLAHILHHGLAPALRQIGVLWKAGQVGIFTEHVAARIAARVLTAVRPLQEQPAEAPLALGGAPEDDPHGLASAMAAGVIEAAGWRVLDLGAFSPQAMLADQARNRGAGLVWVALGSAGEPHRQYALLDSLARALQEAPQRPVLVAGGPSYREWPFPVPTGVKVVESLPELGELARGLRGT